MENQKKYMESVTEFLSIARQTENLTQELVNGVEELNLNIVELNKIEILKNSLSKLSDSVAEIENYNSIIENTYTNIDEFTDLADNVKIAYQNVKTVRETMGQLNVKSTTILEALANVDLNDINNQIEELDKEVEQAKEKIKEDILPYLKGNLDKKIKGLREQIDDIKAEFNSYKERTKDLIRELGKEKASLQEKMQKVIETNIGLTAMIKEMNKSNKNIEQYIDVVFSKWYKENIGIFGIKKRKKKLPQK